ncbi:MAG: Galactose-binding protein regulator [Candidatus Accumulibacter adjunctus]|uniref:Galactose-binding protein regulator n=1 Tax=Candidatus Accumulibacter adjunctus TaxID=1454001 RepID=A0A011N2D2_9PROT|nr:MAG: Galactose-binding protein regulator [Candidatus Accumulibacter adjunctus]
MDIDIRLIRHVLALARQRNFARAAEQLHLSQPALSRSIARLEETLGVALFDRTPEGAIPTAYGRVVIERGQEILRRGQELRRELDLMQGIESGAVSIVAGPFPHAISAGIAVSRLLAAHGGLRVRLAQQSPRGAVAPVLDGSVDLGIADLREWGDDPRLQTEPLPPHVGIWVARADHPLAGRRDLALADVLVYRLICAVLPNQLAEHFGDCPAAGQADPEKGVFYPAVTLDTVSFGPMIAAVSDAIMLTTVGIAAQGLERGELAILDLHLPWQRTAYGFLTRSGRTPSPATLAYMACVRAVEAEAMAEERRLLAHHLGPGFPAAGRWTGARVKPPQPRIGSEKQGAKTKGGP